jgi:hypothetical protein
LPEFWKFEVGEVITTKLMLGVTSSQQLIGGEPGQLVQVLSTLD